MPKPLARPCHRLPDASHADDAEGAAVHVVTQQHHQAPFLPLAGADIAVGFGDAPRDAEQQAPRQVGGGFGDDARCVGDHHAPLRCGRHVHVVVACRHVGHHLEVDARFQECRVDGVCHHGDDAVHANDGLAQGGGVGGLVQGGEVNVAGLPGNRDGFVGQFVGDEDAGCHVPTPRRRLSAAPFRPARDAIPCPRRSWECWRRTRPRAPSCTRRCGWPRSPSARPLPPPRPDAG